MTTAAINEITNFNEYVSFTTKLKSHVDSHLNCSKENLLQYLKTMDSFEVQYFKKYNTCGAAFIIFYIILKNKDYMMAPFDYWEDIAVLLRNWLHAVRHDLIINMYSKNWWTFLEEILGFIQRLSLKSLMRDLLLKATSEYLLELATSKLLDMYQINKVLKTLNKCCCCSKEIRLKLLDEYNDYFVKLSQYIAKCRHMDTQTTALETLLRFLVHRNSVESRTRYANAWFKPPLYPNEVVRVFIENPLKEVFPAIRSFLMTYNHFYGYIISVLCLQVTFGKITINGNVWVDFNAYLGSITISISSETLREMGVVDAYMHEMLQISPQDTEKVESNEEAVVTITTIAGPRFLYNFILEILDEDAKIVHFKLCNQAELPVVERCLKRIFSSKYHLRSLHPFLCTDEGTRHTVSNSEDDSRHKLQKGFVRRIGHITNFTKETKIPCSIALSKSKETNKKKILEDNTTIELNKQPHTNNNNVLDHITKTSIDNQKVLLPNISLNSLSLKKKNTFNTKNNNKIIETVYSDTDSSVPSENIISSEFPKKSLLNNKDVTKVKKSDIVIVSESISRDSYVDSCAPINISQSKQIIKDKPLNKIIIDNNIVENIINESLSRDADSDTLTAPYNVNNRRKKGRIQVKKSINEMVTNCDIVDNVILEAESTFVNSDNAKEFNTNIRSKKKIKNNPLNELIVDVIPETILNEPLSGRADSDLVKEHFLNVDADDSVNEINKDEGIAIESPVIDNTALINRSDPITVKSNAKKERMKKSKKEKLTKTIKETKPLIQRRKSARIQTKNKTISKRKLYSANIEVEEDQNDVNICVNKPFRSEGGSCYKDILRDRKKHIARKSIKCKACSPPLSPKSIKRNELFDQHRTSDESTNNSKLNNRDMTFYNFTTDEDDDDINARCNIYEIKYKSPEPKDDKKKRQKERNKTKSLKAKKKTKNIDEDMVVVNMTDSEDLVKLQDERMRDAPKEDHLNTSMVMITDDDSSDNIVLSKLISKHHMNPVVDIMEVETELLKTKKTKKCYETVKENKAENISAIEEIKVDVKKNVKKRKQQTKADNKVKSKNIKYTKKNVVRNNKVKNKSQESIQSSSPLPELIIEKKVNKISEKSDDDSIERLKLIKNSSDIQEDIELNNVTLNDTIESDENALEMTCEIVEEERDTNKERDKEIMPPPSCSPNKAKKRFLSKSLDSVEVSKRRRKIRLSDFCQEHARVDGEEQIRLDNLLGGPGNRDVREELNISSTNDVAEAPEPWMDEEFLKIRQSFQSFIEEIDKFGIYKQAIQDSFQSFIKDIDKFGIYKQAMEDRFEKFANEFEQLSNQKKY